MTNINKFLQLKKNKQKITMLTCYDYWSAQIINETDIDCILVGDTLAMVMHGHSTTIPVTAEIMAYHTQAVARGANKKFIIGDMPFLTYRKGLYNTMQNVELLMQAGANAIKLEGLTGNEDLIQHIINSGIPVIGHLGLTPQSVNQLGGFKVQGKKDEAKNKILEQAQILENLGCFAVVLECIPALLTKQISNQLKIPTIGIGAGPHADGQVLVLHDMLGLYTNFKPKFVKTYLNGAEIIKQAINNYNHEVKHYDFPTQEHSFNG